MWNCDQIQNDFVLCLKIVLHNLWSLWNCDFLNLNFELKNLSFAMNGFDEIYYKVGCVWIPHEAVRIPYGAAYGQRPSWRCIPLYENSKLRKSYFSPISEIAKALKIDCVVIVRLVQKIKLCCEIVIFYNRNFKILFYDSIWKNSYLGF